jgi:hypothetical protein
MFGSGFNAILPQMFMQQCEKMAATHPAQGSAQFALQ